MAANNQGKTGFVQVAVDLDVCDAAAVCNRIAPQIFQLDDNDTNHILKQPDTEELDRKTRLSVRRCPKQALYLIEEDTK